MGMMLSAAPALDAAMLRLFGPGRLDEYNPQGVLIFDAGKFSFRGDPLGHFYSADAPELDWMRDYFIGMSQDDLIGEEPDFASLAKPSAEEEEAYNKADMVTTASDPGWDQM